MPLRLYSFTDEFRSAAASPQRSIPMPPAPHETREIAAMTVWPTIGATAAGRWVGGLCGMQWGFTRVFTLGNLLALLTIPVSLAVFFWQLMPVVARRYTLTNLRLVVYRGLRPVEERSIGLDQFDAVEVQVLSGQEWLQAGEVVFRRAGSEVFRLSGVPRPEVFRQVCLKSQRAVLSVRRVFEQRTAAT
jgi:hypothetical protein